MHERRTGAPLTIEKCLTALIASQQRAFATIRCSISCVLNVAPPPLKSAVQILGSKQIEMPATDILVDRDLAIIAAARMF